MYSITISLKKDSKHEWMDLSEAPGCDLRWLSWLRLLWDIYRLRIAPGAFQGHRIAFQGVEPMAIMAMAPMARTSME